jgi:hypothetical protein
MLHTVENRCHMVLHTVVMQRSPTHCAELLAQLFVAGQPLPVL